MAQSGVIGQTRRATETAVFCFTNITISSGVKVTLTGDRPMAILSHADMTIGATFDASGGNGTSTSGGLGQLGGGDGRTGQMTETGPTAGEGPGAGGVAPQLWAWHGGGGGGYGGPGGLGGTFSRLPSAGGHSYNTADELEIDLLGGSGGGGSGGCAGAGGGVIELTASGNTSITMMAVTAKDADGVEYYFCNLTDCTRDSGWQSEPTYHDTGLAAGRKYFYRVRARDTSVELNETWWSAPACAIIRDAAS